MPPLGGPGPRRVNKAAVKRRERNLAKLPKATPKRAAVYVPPANAYKPPPPSRPPAPRGDIAGDPQGYKRAMNYRASRPYYRTYRSVWSQSPSVKRAAAQSIQAKQALTSKPGATFAQKQAALARVFKTSRAYEAEQHRGPDVLAGEAYDKYAKGLWKRAGRYYPQSQKQPATKLDYGPLSKRDYAWVYDKQPNVVHVAPQTVRSFEGPKGTRQSSESVLLHEWAHTRQPRELKRNKALTEGGAEAVDRLLAKRLGVTYTPSPDPAYRSWARRARRKGKGYLLHGQYRRAP